MTDITISCTVHFVGESIDDPDYVDEIEWEDEDTKKMSAKAKSIGNDFNSG